MIRTMQKAVFKKACLHVTDFDILMVCSQIKYQPSTVNWVLDKSNAGKQLDYDTRCTIKEAFKFGRTYTEAISYLEDLGWWRLAEAFELAPRL